MEVIEIKPRIYFARFKDQFSMCMTLLRISEHQEDPFRGKIFTIEEYMKWYADSLGGGRFTYDKDISAMCIFGHQIRSFIKKFNNKIMSQDEKDFIEILTNIIPKDILKSNKKFCMICTFHGENSIDFKHEMAHALFYLEKEYRDKVKKIIGKIKKPIKAKLIECLRDFNYNISDLEFIDEINARISSENTVKAGFGNCVRLNSIYTKEAKKIFKEYSSIGGKCGSETVI